MSAKLTPKPVMRLVNEMTEVAARLEDLNNYTIALKHEMRPAEAQLVRAQSEAMGLYSQMLAARIYLMTGVKP